MLKEEEWEKLGIAVKRRGPARRYTSFKVGGEIDLMAWVSRDEQTRFVLDFARERGLPCWTLGRGTNLLVKDEGVGGIALLLTGMYKERRIGESGKKGFKEILAGAGTTLASLASLALENGLEGMECLSGIPGTLGGALRMNAGAGGQEIGPLVESVRLMDPEGSVHSLSGKDIRFGYRDSSLKEQGIILDARLRLGMGKKEDILKKMKEHLQWRKRTQPLEWPSAGSVFKNPEGKSAGRLLEEAGLKGLRAGGAEISSRHANFIVNLGGATASDILELIETATRRVLEKTGIKLELEIQVVGR